MASHSFALALAASAYLISAVAAIDAQLVGTWSTKSAVVLTGPGFYNPTNDTLIEPSHTGYSYSFTSDGYYEEAYYRAISNPTDPACPQAIMQWQHGTVVENADLSLTLTPFAVDGRQLQSDPCNNDHGIYTRYNQSETMAKWQVYVDPYHQVQRLDLYQFDGSMLNPMYMVYTSPQMLPTTTLNPTTTSLAPTATAAAKAKRDGQFYIQPQHLKFSDRFSLDPTVVWWTGVGMVLFGGAAYML